MSTYVVENMSDKQHNKRDLSNNVAFHFSGKSNHRSELSAKQQVTIMCSCLNCTDYHRTSHMCNCYVTLQKTARQYNLKKVSRLKKQETLLKLKDVSSRRERCVCVCIHVTAQTSAYSAMSAGAAPEHCNKSLGAGEKPVTDRFTQQKV